MKRDDKKKGGDKKKRENTGDDNILEVFEQIYNDQPDKKRPNGDTKVPLKCGPYSEWTDLPSYIKVKQFLDKTPPIKLVGPQVDSENKLENYSGVACGKTVSSYPKGQGEPICDHFNVELYMKRWLASVADGCAWGERPREAAKKASAAFLEYLRDNQHQIIDIRDAGRLMLRAFSKAHQKIIEGFDDIWEAGTTTLCAGIMLEIEPDEAVQKQLRELEKSLYPDLSIFDLTDLSPGSRLEKIILAHDGQNKENGEKEQQKQKEKQQSDETENFYGRIGSSATPVASASPNKPHKWIFVCASVGDCKCYHYSSVTGHFTDITDGNRSSLLDAADPGGRLGPYVSPHGEPDLRNMGLYIIPCHDEDAILMMSDGVHDNLDPQNLGLHPKDLNLDFASWAEAESADCAKASDLKNLFRCLYMKRLAEQVNGIGAQFLPELVVERLVKHSLDLTWHSRDFMVNNPQSRLPDDYEKYPGKMDHTTCIAIMAAGCMLPHAQGETNGGTEYSSIRGGLVGGQGGGGAQRNLADASNSVYSTMSGMGRRASEASGGPIRTLPLYNMERELLGEITLDSSALITDAIYQIKHKLKDQIGKRAFRLLKGAVDWSIQPSPVLKKDFSRRATVVFMPGDIIVVQIATKEFKSKENGEKEN